MNLAIIPARTDSKSIKNKNLAILGNKPLIAYSIKTALDCKEINKVIVSTDSEKIAAVARKFGATVPFIRPKNLARDETPMAPVLLHALKFAEKAYQKKIAFIVLLDPTSPFRKVFDIQRCLILAQKPKTDSVVTVCQAEHNPYFVMRKIKNGYLHPILSSKKEIRFRQEAPKVYRINAAVYVIKREILLKGKIFTPRTRALIMPSERSLHIDEPLDLKIAQILLEK